MKEDTPLNVQLARYAEYQHYLAAYHESANILYDAYKEGVSTTKLYYPVLFLMRHTLELAYKFNILFLMRYSGIDSMINSNSHSLLLLNEAYADHFFSAISRIINSDKENIKLKMAKHVKELSDLVQDICKLDAKSDAFRYPVNTKQQKCFPKDFALNITNFKRRYDSAMSLLFRTERLLLSLPDLIPDNQSTADESELLDHPYIGYQKDGYTSFTNEDVLLFGDENDLFETEYQSNLSQVTENDYEGNLDDYLNEFENNIEQMIEKFTFGHDADEEEDI